jgi:cytidyltransferase-like protein
MKQNKIISLNKAKELSSAYKRNKTKVFLAHGVFDVLHLGHIKHFEEIKKNIGKLFVSITDDKHVKRGPGRPYFNSLQRAKMLSAISYVDYVIIDNQPSASEVLAAIKPNIYFKGKDYVDTDDFTKKLKEEIRITKKFNGIVKFTTSQKFSSSNILNTQFEFLNSKTKNFLQKFSRKNNFNIICKNIQKLNNLKILVIGEGIIDEYQYVRSLNKTPKENLISYLVQENKKFLGGIFAVGNNISSFSKNVSLLTICSSDKFFLNLLKKNLNNINNKFIIKSKYHKDIKKVRFIENSYVTKKIFEYYEMSENNIAASDEKKIINFLNSNIKKFDIVVLNDFGHNFFTKKIMETIQSKSKYLALNVQTNSQNTPFNLISKYKRADFVCIDKPEAMLAAGKRDVSLEEIRKILLKKIKFKKICITDGKNGAWYFKKNKFYNIPIFNTDVVDTLGTGDAFFSIASIYSFLEDDNEVVTFLGNVAGAMKVSIVGHSKKIEFVDYLKFVESLLK